MDGQNDAGVTIDDRILCPTEKKTNGIICCLWIIINRFPVHHQRSQLLNTCNMEKVREITKCI